MIWKIKSVTPPKILSFQMASLWVTSEAANKCQQVGVNKSHMVFKMAETVVKSLTTQMEHIHWVLYGNYVKQTRAEQEKEWERICTPALLIGQSAVFALLSQNTQQMKGSDLRISTS